jgi:hypothetical protein
MMIVSVTRGDLRDEFSMADEAFALSPISARAALPSEEDYDAIRDAFMETSRGRWFLGEYARRNRNADTRMVLDAVARIEESLAVQKQPPPDHGLAEALAAIRDAVDKARAAASAAFDGPAMEQSLARIRKGSRIIREISWRWRETGADARICDLLDSQVGAIDDSCERITAVDPLAALSATFDLIEEKIDALDGRDAASATASEEAVSSPAPAAAKEMPAAVSEQAQSMAAEAETAIAGSPAPAETDVAVAEGADIAPAGTDDYDDAMLDLVALEMAAPDPADTEELAETALDETPVEEIRAAEPPRATEPEIVARPPEPAPTPATRPMFHSAPERPPEPSTERSAELSLGSTLIANGIVRRPIALKSDPLAPIRRMSQTEKIALFS